MPINRDKIVRRELLTLLKSWDLCRDGRRMPTAGELGPSQLSPFLSNLALVDVIQPGTRILYKQVGSELEWLYGKPLSGIFLHEMPRRFRFFAEPAYRSLIEERMPAYAQFRFVKRFWIASYERLMLPLSDRSGERVAEILLAIYPKIQKTSALPKVSEEVE